MQNKNLHRATLDKNENQGITLIALVITIVVLMILTATTVSYFVDDEIKGQTENYTNKVNEYLEEQESLSNMVRNLYR